MLMDNILKEIWKWDVDEPFQIIFLVQKSSVMLKMESDVKIKKGSKIKLFILKSRKHLKTRFIK